MTALRWLAFLLCWSCTQRPVVTDPCDREIAKILTGCATEIEMCPDDPCVDKAATACNEQVDKACR